MTARKGTGGRAAATAMADYYAAAAEADEAENVAAYYGERGGVPRQDMAPELAAALGIDPSRAATREEMANLMCGLRADGEEIAGLRQQAAGEGRDRVTYMDFTFSAPKSLSVAVALAPTDAERELLLGVHREAVATAMGYLEGIIGHARKGDGGTKGSVAGEIGWISYEHHEARPVVKVPMAEADGSVSTVSQTINSAGDPQVHTHVLTPNIVATTGGAEGRMYLAALHGRVHEVGAIYHAALATKARAAGIAAGLDRQTKASMLTAIPADVCDLFSQRTKDGEAAARAHAEKLGLDWDTLSNADRVHAMKRGAGVTRERKATDAERGARMHSSAEGWREEARQAGYEHKTVLDPALRNQPAAPERERLTRAYLASLPLLEEEFAKQAVVPAAAARTAAARGLIAVGMETPSDIDKITVAMRERGVLHDGKRTALAWGTLPGAHEGETPVVRITTLRHVDQEIEAMALAEKAAADRTGALTPAQIERAAQRVSARDGLDFEGEHGREQRRVMDHLGTAGRFAVAVGVAGAGKTTLLAPLVDAWREDGREVYGTALAWRQAAPLADAGMKPENTMAMAALLARAGSGKLKLDRKSVVVVDEVSQIGTSQALALARLRDKHGFAIVALGDDKQGQAVEAGNSVALLRKALGASAVPELVSTVRQRRDRDKETTLLFRAGDAEGGLARLREDGHAMLVPGDRKDAITAVVDLWEARQEANAGTKGWTITVSAPTNEDARAIGAAIRDRRRSDGEVGPDQVVLQATDQNGAQFDLPLAVGDRVRLFVRTQASLDGRGGVLGVNGSVLDVEKITDTGLRLRNAKGTSGHVRWSTLADPESGRIRLTYGDALTIDAAQGLTSSEHINALPSGSAAATSFRNYVAQSRSRETSWLVVSDGVERGEVESRRALGSTEPVTAENVWANVARNLARQEAKPLATDLVNTKGFRQGGMASLATAFHPKERREESAEQPAANPRPAPSQSAPQPLPRMKKAASQSSVERQEARAARRSMRPPSQRPKAPESRAPLSAIEAEAEFREALHRAGLRPKGQVHMDGQRHYTEVEGSRSKRGFYVAHLDGAVPAGTIINHQTGQRVDWRASNAPPPMTAGEREAESRRQADARAVRERARQDEQAKAAAKARTTWDRARPVQSHPYLTRKGVEAHGLRQDRRGNLLAPMRDVDGELWNVQTISADGDKLYMRDARKQGLHALLGELKAGTALVIAEGFATGATIREATGLPVAVAFDSVNLAHVARAHRQRDPKRPLVFAADNDHHLPGVSSRHQASAEGKVTVRWPEGATGKADRGNTVEYRMQGIQEWTLAAKGWRKPEIELLNLVPSARYEVRVYNSKHPRPLANEGIVKATKAAEEVEGVMLVPDFVPGAKGTDWNDYAAQHGRDAVRQRVRGELQKNGIELPELTQAERDAARRQASSAPPASVAADAARRATQTHGPSAPSL